MNDPIPDLQELVQCITVLGEPHYYVKVSDAQRLLKQLVAVNAERDRLAAAVESLRPILNTCQKAEDEMREINGSPWVRRDFRVIRSGIATALQALEPRAAEAAKAKEPTK